MIRTKIPLALTLTALLTAAGAMSGCARVQIRKQRIAEGKSLAIVGFEGELWLTLEQRPKDKKQPPSKMRMTLPEDQLDALATWSYDALVETLQGKFGWKVLTRAELLASPAYQRQHEQWMKSAMKAPSTPNTFVTVPGITWMRKIFFVPGSDYAEMASELGVDAVAVVGMTWRYERHPPADDGTMDHHPYGHVYIDMTDAGRAETIWLDNTISGKPVQGAQFLRDGQVMGDDLVVMLRKAMLAAYQTMLEHYDHPPAE